jgi:hypothetical protein
MGTNFYRIPSVNELETRRNRLMARVRRMELSASSVNSNFAIENPEVFEDWTPWDEFSDSVKVHLGKRSMGWKFLWNFNDDKYFKDKESLFKFIRSGRIVDEYGNEMNQEKFIDMALSWGKEDGYDIESYSLEYPERRTYWSKPERCVDGLRISDSTNFS